MIPKTFRPLIKALLSATETNKVRWRRTSSDAYMCSRREYTFHMRYLFIEDAGEAMYILNMSKGEDYAPCTVLRREDEFAFMQEIYASIVLNAMEDDDPATIFASEHQSEKATCH